MIYPQQIVAALEIISKFDKASYAILLAQMQSGKTGTFMLVLCEMIRLGKVDFGVIFSGNRETDLKKQTENQDDFFENYELYLRTIGITDLSIVQTIKDKRFHVVWGPDLKHFTPKGKTIYIWEESHYGQSSRQEVDKFNQRVGIDATGQTPEDGSFVLSVSATPFSEFIDNYTLEQGKPIVRLIPPEQYLSVQKMIENKQLRFYNQDPRAQFEKCLLTYTEPGYSIVRGMASILEPIAKKYGWATIHYDLNSKGSVNLDEIMTVRPTQPTVIFIKGMLRMGKQLKKNFVRFVFESSRSTKTDAILQGLLGRCCGYDSRPDIDVYIRQYNDIIRVPVLNKDGVQIKQRICVEGKPVRIVPCWHYKDFNLTEEDIQQFVALHMGLPFTPFRGTNLVGKVGTSHTVYDYQVPIKISLDKDELATILTKGKSKRKEKREILERLLNPENPEHNYVATNCLKTIKIRYPDQAPVLAAADKKLYEKLELAVLKKSPYEPAASIGVAPGEVSIFINDSNIYITYSKDKIDSMKKGLSVHIGQTTGREVFSRRHNGPSVTPEFRVNLPATISTNRADFVDSISECIRIWREAQSLITQNFISSKHGIVLNEDIFTQIKPGGSIFQEFKTKGITLSYSILHKGSTVKLSKISWEESNVEEIPEAIARSLNAPVPEYIMEGIVKGSSF